MHTTDMDTTNGKGTGSPSIIYDYNRNDHMQRLNNIKYCQQSINGCMRKHLVTGYIPGHFVYDDRPKDFRPLEKDTKILADLKSRGIGLIQLWSRWWDNPWGGSPMYQSERKQGMREFIGLVHQFGMKVIPYTSTNFFERTDPNFDPAWAFPQCFDLVEDDFHLAHCTASSPGWREHVLASTIRILDDYGFDGLYNDMGYLRRSDYIRSAAYYQSDPKLAEDEIIAFTETPTHDGAVQDMLGILYAEVKRRGGIYKLHKEGFDTVHTDFRVYDYLWVGEAVHGIDVLRAKTKNYDPYVIPEYSRSFSLKSENDIYLNSIPYMQFPVSRSTNNTGGAMDNHDLHTYWLKRYLPLVEEGTWAWLDVQDGKLFGKPLPENVVVSVFVNREFYLVLANFSDSLATVILSAEYVATDDLNSQPSAVWELPGGSLLILKLINTNN